MASSSLYQSTLVRDGTTELFIDGEVKDGTYGPYVPVKLRNGDRKFLNIENDEVRKVLEQAPQERWIKVTATGSRGDARISVQGDDPRDQHQHTGPANRPSYAGNGEQGGQDQGSALFLMYQALDHAQWILEDRGIGEVKTYDLVSLAGYLALVAATRGEMLPEFPNKG